MKRPLILLGVGLLTAGIALGQATPPGYLNYQGVLRDASDSALDGPHNMIFRFYDTDGGPSCTSGSLLLTDAHLAAGSGAVEVTGGMFNVPLGSGVITVGTASTLAEVFRENAEVWLEPDVGSENMCPRIRIVSAGYALNAGALGGLDATHFLRGDSGGSIDSGTLTIAAGATLDVEGTLQADFFFDRDNPAYFLAPNGQSFLNGIQLANVYMHMNYDGPDADSRIYFYEDGIKTGENLGWNDGADRFTFSDDLWVYGKTTSTRFEDPDNPTFFVDPSGQSFLNGIQLANVGMFLNYDGPDLDSRVYFYDGGDKYGEHFGWFDDEDRFQVSDDLYIGGDATTGVEAGGTTAGGLFYDATQTGTAYLGYGDRGIEARGDGAAGYFEETDSDAKAWVAWKDLGIEARGTWIGALIYDATDSGTAYIGYGGEGIRAFGNSSGGYFYDADDTGAWGRVGQNYGGTNYKIRGGGTVSFVQNHPERSDRVVVYAAPEGDEVAVYTRGRARFQDGLARVALGETFRWVANPDIGLTAHVTPRTPDAVLYVESVGTTELVVRAVNGFALEGEFDYVVYGLRLGFEQMAPVQDKQDYAPVPELDASEPYYEQYPDLRGFNALERFSAMRTALGETEPVDLSGTLELVAAVNRFDPEIDAALLPEAHERHEAETAREEMQAGSREPAMQRETSGSKDVERPAISAGAGLLPVDPDGNVYGRSFRPSATDLAGLVRVSETVEVGDVLVADPSSPGDMRRSASAADPSVVGIVAGQAGLLLGSAPREVSEQISSDVEHAETRPELIVSPQEPLVEAPVAFSGIVLCKVDAGFGTIQVGDLLTTSPTPGHAMRSDEPRPGTILGKALEPLDTGTGQIKVLVMLR